jgi:hypothetical protein
MPMNELLHKLIDIGEAADNLCRALPNHRLHMALRDFHSQIANAMLSLSPEMRKQIANG